ATDCAVPTFAALTRGVSPSPGGEDTFNLDATRGTLTRHAPTSTRHAQRRGAMTQQAVTVAEPTEAPARAPRPSRWGPRRQGVAFDFTVVVVLIVIGFLVRRDGLPTNGLFPDDAWVATGAIYGPLSNLITVGSAHPGFTLFLMAWHGLGGGGLRSLAFPAFTAGVATGPLLYLGLRSFRYDRSI